MLTLFPAELRRPSRCASATPLTTRRNTSRWPCALRDRDVLAEGTAHLLGKQGH